MLAGAFKTDITPCDLPGTLLAGFGFNRTATGVLDPLHARVLYLSDGDREAAIAVLDLIGVNRSTTRRIRSKVKTVKPGGVHVCCTHTHSGPDTIGLWGPAVGGSIPYASGMDHAYMEWLEDEVAYAIDKAKYRAVPASFRIAVDDGSKEDWSRNIRDGKTGIETVTAIHLTDRAGKTIAAVVNFGSHPEALWESNRLVSADYVGRTMAVVEEALGGVGVFWNGALGGMVTVAYDEQMAQSRRPVWMKQVGEALGGIALEALDKRARPLPVSSVSLSTREVAVPMENRLFHLVRNLGIFDRDLDGDDLVTEVSLMELGPVRIALFPGEPVPAVGRRILEILGGPDSFLVSLSDDEIGYVLEGEMFDDPRYAYECSMSLGRHTADRLCDALKELVGG